MKRIIVCTLLLCGAMIASAQTYNDGVWYALYDEESHTMNTQGDYETGGVFAPTDGTLNVQWKYEWLDWLGAFAKIDTKVLESGNGGSSTNQVGSLSENTGKNSNTTESFTVSCDINWIKFSREGYPTHKVILYHLDIPLAKHILLASETYGTSIASLDFEAQDMLTVSEAQHINLRSFLTAGDISVTSSKPDIFRIGTAENTAGLNYAVGANACASENGTAQAASGGTLGNIANYGFDVYFCPQEDKNYEALITITDGLSTASVIVRGTGLYVAPPTPPEDTYFAYSASICEGDSYSDDLFLDLTQAGDYTDTIPNVAGADSIITFTLTVNPVYAYADSLSIRIGQVETWHQQDLSLLPVGDTILTAAYNTVTGCDSVYTLYLTVQPPVPTFGNDTIEICQGEKAEFEGKTYRRATVDSVLLSQPNQFGGDSIVELVVIVHPAVKIEVSETIREGAEQEWQGYDLSQYPVGDTTLVAEYSSAYGCDSTYVLHLTVLLNTEGITVPDGKKETTVDKIIINGRLYIRKGEDYFDVLGRKV